MFASLSSADFGLEDDPAEAMGLRTLKALGAGSRTDLEGLICHEEVQTEELQRNQDAEH